MGKINESDVGPTVTRDEVSYEALYVANDVTTSLQTVKTSLGDTDSAFQLAIDSIMMIGTNRLEFGDTGTFIHQSADGVLTIESDTTIEMKGNVGIGDTNPSSSILSLESSGNNNLQMSPDGTAIHQLRWDSNGLYIHGDYNNGSGSSKVTINTGGVERMLIDDTGNVTVSTGNLVIGTAGKGIDFSASADGSGTVTAELLDDYEEGYFTASMTLGSGTASIDTAHDQMAYTKVGRVVNIQGRIHVNAVSTPSGSVKLNGLPFASQSLNESADLALIHVGFWALTGTLSGQPHGVIPTGSSVIDLYDKVWDSTEGSGDWGDHLDSDIWIYFSGSYIAA